MSAQKLNLSLTMGQGKFLHVLKEEVKKVGINTIAQIAEINRTHLYDLLARGGNPCLRNLRKLLRALNLDIQIVKKS